MRQILSISVAFVFVLTLSAWVLHVHSCQGEIKSISFVEVESCHIEEPEAAACHSEEIEETVCHSEELSCCASKMMDTCCSSEETTDENDGCCDNDQIIIDYDYPVFYVAPYSLSDVVTFSTDIANYSRVSMTIPAQDVPSGYHNTPRPPPDDGPLFILFQSFLFYG